MVKAEARTEGKHTSVSVGLDGVALDIANEIVAIIQSMMGNLKRESEMLYALVIKTMADDPSILLGEDEDSETMKLFENFDRKKKGAN